MAGVNATRAGLAQNVTDATEGARLIGFDENGRACVWHGGYSFNVYDATRDWQEVDHFTSGIIAGLSNKQGENAKQAARRLMQNHGYDLVE
jgi:hypothetical protein